MHLGVAYAPIPVHLLLVGGEKRLNLCAACILHNVPSNGQRHQTPRWDATTGEYLGHARTARDF